MTSCHLKTKKEVCQDYLNARRRAAGIIYLPPLKTVLFHLSLSISVFIYSFTLCPVDAAFFFISSFLPLGTVKFILSYFSFNLSRSAQLFILTLINSTMKLKDLLSSFIFSGYCSDSPRPAPEVTSCHFFKVKKIKYFFKKY